MPGTRGVGAAPRGVGAPVGTLLLPPHYEGPPHAFQAVLLCSRVGAPHFSARGGLLLSSPAGVLRLKPPPSLFLLLWNRTGTALCSSSW